MKFSSLDVVVAQAGLAQPASDTSTGSSQESAPASKPTGGGGGWDVFVLFGVMILVFYFLMIRPQQKRQKKHKEMTESLKRGDNIITTAGIYGRVENVEAETVVLEIAKGTQIKMLKSQVAGRQASATEGGAEQDKKAIRDAV